ncbi:MAG: DNA primase [Candidatus Odyssella sp.]|nr:DNA primase [Candidatus Odyssella sp.]
MAFPPRFLDEIRNRLSLAEAIGRRVKLARRGREFVGLCPFHHEKSPSFTVVEEKNFYHCFAGETGVLTRDGTVPIASLAGKAATVLTRGGQWVRAPFKEYGRQRLYRIELSRNGVPKTLFATSGHRWFVRGRKSALVTTELRKGNRLEAVAPRTRENWSLDARGVRHGIVFGDGTVQRKGKSGYGTVNLHGEKAADLARWFAAYNPSERFREGGEEYLRVYGGRDFEGMKALPAPDESEDYVLGFLAGYLATDGHVAKDGTVMLHCIDPSVLRWVRDTATRLGIGTFGMTAQARRGYLANEAPVHRIHFVASTLAPDMLLRREARQRWEKSAKAFERLRWAVLSVKPTDRIEAVYCAEVPEHHAFALEDNILTGNCFGCGAHGDVIGFTMRTEGLPFPEAVERLAGEAGLALPERDPRAEEHARIAKTLYDANEAAAEWFAAQLYTPEGRTALEYLKRRGLEDRTIARFRLGYAPESRDALKRALVPKGYGEAQLVEAGLLIKPDDGRSPYDRFRGRVMFPIADKRGRVIAFGGRVLGDEKPKYLNSPDTPLFHKGRVLYAYREARAAAHAGADVIVAEGYMDVIALHQGGFEGAVAPLGTALTEAQIEELWRVKPEPLLCFDGDEAGRRAAARAAERVLPILKPGHSLRFVFLPEGEDPDSLIRDGGAAAMKSVLGQAVPLVEWLWRMETHARPLDTPERRAALRKSVLERAAAIPERSVQAQYAAEFEERLARLFAPAPRPARWTGRAAPAGTRYGGRAPAPSLSNFLLKSDGNTDRMRLRAQQALLGLLILYPNLLESLHEEAGRLELPPGGELDRLRNALLNSPADLDTEALKNHLAQLGFSDALKQVMNPEIHHAFRNPMSRTQLEPAALWRAVSAGLTERPAMEKELAAAERRLAEEPSARNLGRLNAVKSQTAAARGNATTFDAPQDREPENGLRRDREGS